MTLLMNGEISVTSKVNQGSIFTVTIPFKTKVNKENSQVDKASSYDLVGEPLNILALEDNETNIMIIERYLKKLGHNFTILKNGKYGIEEVVKNSYDIVLTDIQMPIMSGIDFFKAAKEDSSLSHIKLVAITANALEDDIKYYKELGFDDVLGKPLKISDLYDCLSRFSKRAA